MGEKDSNSGPALPPDKPEDDGKKSGRVVFDSRGNSVWEWQMKTGVFGRDIDTQRLKKFEDQAHLSMADDSTENPAGPAGAAAAAAQSETGKSPKKMYPGKPAARGGGFNPYDHGVSGGVSSPPAAPRGNFDPLNRSQADKPGGAPKPKKPGLLRRLFGKS